MRSPDTPPTDAAHGRGYETRDVNLRAILWLAAVVVVLVVVSMIGLDMLWNAYIAQAKEADPVLSPLADLDQTPPLPRLQSSPNVELVEYLAQQEEKVTTYGWVEYTTGSIDGAVWGVPIRAILLTTSSGAPKGTTAVIDALEIRRVPGNPVAANACSPSDVDSNCGPAGDCLFGRCVPSSVTWGVLPSAEFRRDFAERWAFIASSIVGMISIVSTPSMIFPPGNSGG